MVTALFITVVLGSIAVLLSWELDRQKKNQFLEKKAQEDKIYRLSVLKEVSERIAYTSDTEKVIDEIMTSLRNFFDYSTASSIVIRQVDLVFKTYVEEEVNKKYIEIVEEKMRESLSQLAGNLPKDTCRQIYGLPLNDTGKSIYLSSFHAPLIVNNKVLALIHLSSIKENLYKKEDIDDLHELISIATSSLNRFDQALDMEREKFTSLMESINDGIFMADNKNNLLYINDSCKKLLKLDKESIGFFDVNNAFPESLNLGSKINETLLENKPSGIKEIIINDKIFDIFINHIPDKKVSIVLRDISEYKVRENIREDLTNIMIHELRSPITNIKDSAELIISTNNLEEDKKLKFLRIIHQQAIKILDQISSILDTAKLDAGKLTLQKTKGDIAELIRQEVEIFIPQAQRKNISLDVDILAKPLPLISFDAIKITQVIDNLLSNSLKFTPSGGRIKIEVDYKTIPPNIDGSSPMEKILSLDKFVIISVSDTGVGIAKDQQKLLFLKYTQARNTPDKMTKLGTGLGLYVVRGIVEAHGGLVWVKSAPGQGTTFSFTLPATDDAKTSHEALEPNPSPLTKLARTVN